jgi:hypothetical protein
MARRQRDASTATAHEGLQLRSRSDIRTAASAAVRHHRTEAGRTQFFRRARARAARILLANWRALDAVADALLVRGALDGRELDCLMLAAARRRSGRPG